MTKISIFSILSLISICVLPIANAEEIGFGGERASGVSSNVPQGCCPVCPETSKISCKYHGKDGKDDDSTDGGNKPGRATPGTAGMGT